LYKNELGREPIAPSAECEAIGALWRPALEAGTLTMFMISSTFEHPQTPVVRPGNRLI
jgi:hypothetical protein